MICPACKNTIEDGYVLCSVCGHEINIVPAYDAELENKMDEAISAMLEGINLDELSEDDVKRLTDTMDMKSSEELKRRIALGRTRDLSKEIEQTAAEKEKEKKEKAEENKKRLISAGVAILLIAIIVVGIFLGYKNMSSIDHLLLKAQKYQANGEFNQACEIYNDIIQKNGGDQTTVIGLSYCLSRAGRRDEAIHNLLDFIHLTENESAYEQLIALYEDEEEYDKIALLLEECKNETVRGIYSKYIVAVPEFDVPEGVYENEIAVKLMTSVPGYIYYTTDGSEPTVKSNEYTEPIVLKHGKIVVRAIFVNGIGIASDSTSHIYEIESVHPEVPEIVPQEGTYEKAEYITVSANEACKLYYTLDGTMPDENSSLYEKPLLMQEGDSTVKFIAIDNEGRRSDVASCHYSLKLNALCLKNDALNYVSASLTAIGQYQDMTGKAMLETGNYSLECIGIVYHDGYNYYLIEESYSDNPAVSSNSTGRFYGVNSMTGTLMRASKDEDGYFNFTDF